MQNKLQINHQNLWCQKVMNQNLMSQTKSALLRIQGPVKESNVPTYTRRKPANPTVGMASALTKPTVILDTQLDYVLTMKGLVGVDGVWIVDSDILLSLIDRITVGIGLINMIF